MEKVRDPETGISIRFIQQFDIVPGESYREDLVSTRAFNLAMCDDRPIAFLQKLADALQFLAENPGN